LKTVVGVSIGSSTRNHKVTTQILGEKYIIQRIGTDGSIDKAIELIKELDGKVDAFGMGGIDLYLSGAGKKFMIKEAMPIFEAAQKTPIVDGTGLKNTLEKSVIEYLSNNKIIDFTNKKVLMVCAIDRFKMAEAFISQGADITIGDLIFALGIPAPIKSIRMFKRIVRILLPMVARLPYQVLYPVGDKQDDCSKQQKFTKYYDEADIIAGDFLYIKKHLPEFIDNKIIITNTVTSWDVELLRERGAHLLVTSTPELNGRSFGTNIMEAVLVAASGKRPEDLTISDYHSMIKKIGILPRIEYLQDRNLIDKGKVL